MAEPASWSPYAKLLNADAKDDEKPHETTPEERRIVNKCLDAVEKRAKGFEEKGLSTNSFVIGVTNTLFIAWAFGAVPQHFWLVYLLEVSVLFPLRWKNQTAQRPLRGHFYWLDFCWVANIIAVICLLFLLCDGLINDEASTPGSWRKTAFCAFFGIACGPLLMATGLLGNSLLFHDVDNVASVLIHLFPSLTMYTLLWEHDKIHAAWPTVFHLDYINDIDPLRDIFGNSAMLYTVWAILYTVWILAHGLKLPAKGFDTIYHANMRGGMGSTLAKKLKVPKEQHAMAVRDNKFPPLFLVAYMFAHAMGTYVAMSVSLLCFWKFYIHGAICAVMTFSTIYNAGNRYNYYMVKVYADDVRKTLGIPKNRHASAYNIDVPQA